MGEYLYRTVHLGFTYQFRSGWVVADDATREKLMEARVIDSLGVMSPSAAEEHAAVQKCSRDLLMVNRFPVGTKTEGSNPFVALMVVDPACFPTDIRFPSSFDDHEQVLASESKRLSGPIADAPFFGKAQTSAMLSSVDGRVWIDLSSIAKVNIPASEAPLAIFTEIDITQVRDYWAAWIFMGGSQAELDQLRHTPITFSSPSPAPTAP